MRRVFMIAAMATLAVAGTAHPSLAGVAVRVGGGMSYIRYGDYDDFVDSINRRIGAAGSTDATLDEMHWVPELSGEMLFSLLPWLDIGAGIGLIFGTSRFSIEPSLIDFEHAVRVYPITATAYARLPSPVTLATPYAYAGVGAYRTTVTFDFSTPVDTLTYTSDLSVWGYGIHAGAGFAFAVFPRISVDLGVKGRSMKAAGLKGSARRGDGMSEDVFLAYSAGDRGLVYYGPVTVRDRDKYREGVVDLTGIAVCLSIRISF